VQVAVLWFGSPGNDPAQAMGLMIGPRSDIMATFADLGIPFPLFEAPTTEASDYAGIATCRHCGGREWHCFELGIGDALIVPCSVCGVENGLSADGRRDVTCRSCGTTVPFPEPLRAKKQMLVCYDCLRAGKAAMTKSTEFGMVSWDQAFEAVTHGIPGLRTDQFEVVPIDPDEDWHGVRVPNEHLWELLRTPGFSNWQVERWLFCCRRPMAYVGGWRQVMESHRPDDPRAFFEPLLDPDDEAKEWAWECLDTGQVSLYVYRCRACGRFRATWDTD
jgi:uncharacterized protein CbrC (UPF0167 family)